MEQETLKRIEENSKKLEEVYRSIEKMRKYFLWTLIISVTVIILPLIGLMFVLPNFLNTISGSGLPGL